MNKYRLEAFSDGVIAILITVMVFKIDTPDESDWNSLKPALFSITTYAMSFLYLGIYWNNHHHTFILVERIDGTILWANLHLLFWLSLIPFATAWIHTTGIVPWATATYGFVLLMSGIAYRLLQSSIVRTQGPGSELQRAIGKDFKGMLSLFAYVAGVILAFVSPMLSIALYVLVALMWLIPDRRIELTFNNV